MYHTTLFAKHAAKQGSPNWLTHRRNLVGDTGDVSPLLFQTGGYDMPCPPTFFSLGFVFGEISKIKVVFVTNCGKSFLC